jgi:hypothetical protein
MILWIISGIYFQDQNNTRMNNMFRYLLFIFLFSGSSFLNAQEFNCQLQVIARQVEGTDKKVFQTLQDELIKFISDRRWTNYQFKVEERIDCSIVMNITERPSSDVFKGNITIVATRPAYKTSYASTLINYIDKDFQFEYVEFQPLDFIENTHSSNLTSVLAYYLYIILGLDFDSFSPMGGTPFFEKAQQIVNAAQNTPEPGWKSFESMLNRYWMVENYLNNSYQDLRKFSYEYHRKGLDVMSEKAEPGRAWIYDNLKMLENLYNEKPGLYILQLFIDSKRDELINIFTMGTPTEKTGAVQLLKKIDPSNANQYMKISTGK